MHSMTAYASLQKQINGILFCWEIRSVNHRYLDVSFRLPELYRFLETELRASLRDKIYRGKLDCQLKCQNADSGNQTMMINKNLTQELIGISHEMVESFDLANDMSVTEVLRWPGVIQSIQQNTEELGAHVLQIFGETIDKLTEVRAKEGASLKEQIKLRLHAMTRELASCQSLVTSLASQTKEKLQARIQSLAIEIPDSRLDQEIALILTRLDVSEELDRLQIHLDEVNRILNCDKVAGRRLDFLMQELNREANTLSSKSDSAELTRCAVEMKVLIEQMREQIQNIE